MAKVSLETLAREIAADADVTQAKALEITRTIFTAIAENLEGGHEVHVPGFAKFRVKSRPERQARNPKTGEAMTVAAKRVPNVLFAKALKEQVS
jgi:DNA-binding protein HU-beta